MVLSPGRKQWDLGVESAKGGPLILGYDCDDMPTLDALTEFFATQGLPTTLTESTRRDYDSD